MNKQHRTVQSKQREPTEMEKFCISGSLSLSLSFSPNVGNQYLKISVRTNDSNSFCTRNLCRALCRVSSVCFLFEGVKLGVGSITHGPQWRLSPGLAMHLSHHLVDWLDGKSFCIKWNMQILINELQQILNDPILCLVMSNCQSFVHRPFFITSGAGRENTAGVYACDSVAFANRPNPGRVLAYFMTHMPHTIDANNLHSTITIHDSNGSRNGHFTIATILKLILIELQNDGRCT